MQLNMALVGTLFARLLAGGRGLQESQDVWKLYHLLHYFQQCGGMEVRVARPGKVSPRTRYSAVHAAVTAQVYSWTVGMGGVGSGWSLHYG